MIIDVHTHIFPSLPGKPLAFYPQQKIDELYKTKKETLGKKFEEWKDSIDGSVEALIRDMNEAGIDKSLAMPLDFSVMCREEPEISIWKVNEYTAEAQKKYPDRIIGFAGVDPRRRDAIDLIEKGIKQWGLKGIKIAPNHYYLTDSEIQRFMTKVDDMGATLMIHVGSDPLPYLVEHGDPKDLATLLLRYQNIKIMAAHCARGHENLLLELLQYNQSRLFADISGRQYEWLYSRWHFIMFIRYFMDRIPKTILMGSDWPFIKNPPMPTHKQWFEGIRNLKIPAVGSEFGMNDFSQKEKDMILGENARALLKI